MAEDRTHPPRPTGPRLIDLIGLVVGFGTSALLLRSLWPSSRSMAPGVAVVAGILHLWLGLAMAGPVLLLIDRRGLNDATRQLSWAQVAWLLIGSYWLAMTALVVPTRMAVHPLLGVVPVVAALVLRRIGPRSPEAGLRARSWTDRVAIGLMMTWPIAWGAMILLVKTLF
ncbi:hypothetical protein [Tautonia plasticadhaerens]|uniref:Uncharacterized protein n=1 Tax=Tautonia plasticadhaerens TaxID=2527974 RepID=A0A518H8R2_9BACT|nr:hypothetical protein [Tautonia plasticadhaerens]QDV37248.1 hypothetical protein ElP_51830 [Tautonia plasticadhaerens]